MTNTALEDEHKSCTSLGQQSFFQGALNVNKSFHRRKMPWPDRPVKKVVEWSVILAGIQIFHFGFDARKEE